MEPPRTRRRSSARLDSRLIRQFDDDHDKLELLIRAVQVLRQRVYALEDRVVDLERRLDDSEIGPDAARIIRRIRPRD